MYKLSMFFLFIALFMSCNKTGKESEQIYKQINLLPLHESNQENIAPDKNEFETNLVKSTPELVIYLLNIRGSSNNSSTDVNLFDFYSDYFYDNGSRMDKVFVQSTLFLCIENTNTKETGYIYIGKTGFYGKDILSNESKNFHAFYQFYPMFNVYLNMEDNCLELIYQQIDEGYSGPLILITKVEMPKYLDVLFTGLKCQNYNFDEEYFTNSDLTFSINLLKKANTFINHQRTSLMIVFGTCFLALKATI